MSNNTDSPQIDRQAIRDLFEELLSRIESDSSLIDGEFGGGWEADTKTALGQWRRRIDDILPRDDRD